MHTAFTGPANDALVASPSVEPEADEPASVLAEPVAGVPSYAARGVFVALEGGEGSGKSTQSRRLHDRLTAEGYAVRLTHEPGDTPVGADLRRIVLSPETGTLADRTEALLYAADKAEHVERVVALLPELVARVRAAESL